MPDPIWSQLLLQVILIAINAFFAATEIAVISLNGNMLKKQSEEGDQKATKMLRMVEKPEGFLSTIQVAITLSGFLGSAFAANNFAEKLSDWLVNDLKVGIPYDVVNNISIILITLILSYITLVLGELVPKRIAMKKPEAVASAVSGIIMFFSVMLKPVVWLLSVSTNGILRLLGINPHDEGDEVTEEEIRMMVDIGEERGNIETKEKEMIENVFEFNNISAYDVMVHRTEITALEIDEEPQVIIQTIVESGFSRIPVYEGDIDHIIGILSIRKYLLNERSENPLPLRELLYPAHLVPETVAADVLFRDMQVKNIHIAIVLDEYGGTSGLVTMEDLVEEIVGNIYDEFDDKSDEEYIIKLDDERWRVSGSADLESVSEEIGVELCDENSEYDTVGGLIFSQLSAIPEDGTDIEVIVNNLEITVESFVDRRVEWAIITKLPEPEEDEEDDDDDKDDYDDAKTVKSSDSAKADTDKNTEKSSKAKESASKSREKEKSSSVGDKSKKI